MSDERDPMTVAEAAAIYDEYESSVMAGDALRWMDLWSDDGPVKMQPGLPALVGKDAIRALMEADFAAHDYPSMKILTEEVQTSGDLAFARGTCTLDFETKDGGDHGTVDAKFLTIFQRQPDGSWKIYRDIHNLNVP